MNLSFFTARALKPETSSEFGDGEQLLHKPLGAGALASVALALLSAGLSNPAAAAINPGSSTLGSSSGSTELSVTRTNTRLGDNVIIINDLNDFNFGLLGASSATQSDAVCVASSSGLYEITMRSQHHDGSGGFRLSDNTSTPTFISYQVRWDDLQGGAGIELRHGTQSPQFSGADTAEPDCSTTGPTARLEVTINPVDFTGAVFGQLYTDTLTVTAGIL